MHPKIEDTWHRLSHPKEYWTDRLRAAMDKEYYLSQEEEILAELRKAIRKLESLRLSATINSEIKSRFGRDDRWVSGPEKLSTFKIIRSYAEASTRASATSEIRALIETLIFDRKGGYKGRAVEFYVRHFGVPAANAGNIERLCDLLDLLRDNDEAERKAVEATIFSIGRAAAPKLAQRVNFVRGSSNPTLRTLHLLDRELAEPFIRTYMEDLRASVAAVARETLRGVTVAHIAVRDSWMEYDETSIDDHVRKIYDQIRVLTGIVSPSEVRAVMAPLVASVPREVPISSKHGRSGHQSSATIGSNPLREKLEAAIEQFCGER